MIRVGGWSGEQGFGELTITLNPLSCPVGAARPMGEEWYDLCSEDADCWPGPVTEAYCIPSPSAEPEELGACYAPKHRYISVARNPQQLPNTARRITLQDGPVLGWVGAPSYNESGGVWIAQIVDQPTYDYVHFDGAWPDIVHVTGCEIATNKTYQVQAIILGDDTGDEWNYSEAVELRTPSVWGDTVSTCVGGVCQPPDGAASLADIMVVIHYFQGVHLAPLPWLDISPSADSETPDQNINLGDIMGCIGAFQGESYPGLGPLNCP